MKGSGDQGPRFVEPFALVPATRGEDRLRSAGAPAHAALFEPLRDERLACRLHDARADHEAARLQLGVAHAPAVLSEVAQRLTDRVAARVLVGQMLDRADDLLAALRVGARCLAKAVKKSLGLS